MRYSNFATSDQKLPFLKNFPILFLSPIIASGDGRESVPANNITVLYRHTAYAALPSAPLGQGGQRFDAPSPGRVGRTACQARPADRRAGAASPSRAPPPPPSSPSLPGLRGQAEGRVMRHRLHGQLAWPPYPTPLARDDACTRRYSGRVNEATALGAATSVRFCRLDYDVGFGTGLLTSSTPHAVRRGCVPS